MNQLSVSAKEMSHVCDSLVKMAASIVYSPEILKKQSLIPEDCGKFENVIKSEDVEGLEIDLSIKCRGCFAEDPEMHYLFAVFDQDLSLADILMQTTTVVCKSDDGFPPYLCTRCTSSLIDFFNFKIQLQKTDLYVRTLLGKTFTDNFSSAKSESNTDDLILDEEYGVLQAQYDSQDDNSLHVQGNDVVPDINSLAGISSPQCSACLLKFNNISECETHMAKAHGKNPFAKYWLFRKQIADQAKAVVENRKKRRLQEYSLQQEILRMKPGKLCRICKEKFPENEFSAHWDSHKKYECEECGHRCIKTSDLKIHKLSVHNDARTFSCSLCAKTFKTKPLLKRHQVVHLNPRMFCCDICGQRFNDRGTLRTHIQLKHMRTRDFICPICGLSFPMKSTLDKHILRHDKNRPPSFYCHVCSSAFKDKSSLKRHHLVKHSNSFVKPTCQFCGKSYCSNTKLRYHIERHHSGKVVERQKRGPRKLHEAEFSLTESEDSNDNFDDTRQQRSIATNVRQDFYKSSPGYQDDQTEDDPTEDDPDYVAYQQALHLEESSSEHIKSDSD